MHPQVSYNTMMQYSFARAGNPFFFPARSMNTEIPFRRIAYNARKIGVQWSFFEGSRVVLRPQVQRIISNPKGSFVSASYGSRIPGLGDLGVQGIGIAIGKLDLYVAAAEINPQRVLPIMIDVGTNNEKLLKDPLYLGLQQHRLDVEDYLAVIDGFMEAVFFLLVGPMS